MLSFHDAVTNCAYIVANSDHEDIVGLISGDYVTFAYAVYGQSGLLGFELDGTGPWPHGLGTDGIRGVDAASLYETVLQMIDDFVRSTGRWGEEEE